MYSLYGVRFLRNVLLFFHAVLERVFVRERERVCESGQQFCVIEMDRMGHLQPALPIKRLSCSTHTAAYGLKLVGLFSCFAPVAADRQEVVLRTDCQAGD